MDLLQSGFKRGYFFPFSFLFILSGTGHAQTKFISYNHPSLYYEGRVSKNKDAAELSWSGTSVTIFFKGTNLSAILKDAGTANYYNVIVDNKDIFKIHTDTIKKTYVLASGLVNKNIESNYLSERNGPWVRRGCMDLKLQKPPKYFKQHLPQKEKLNFMETLLPVAMQ